MNFSEITMYALWLIPIIIGIVYARWSNKQDQIMIKTVNDAFDKAESKALLVTEDVPDQEIDYQDSERPLINWHTNEK